MLQTVITKKAAAIIATFNKREMDIYNTRIVTGKKIGIAHV